VTASPVLISAADRGYWRSIRVEIMKSLKSYGYFRNAVFDNKKSAIETATVILETNGQWRVSGYFIQ